MNSSPSRIDGAWSSIKPVVSAPFELAMMVVMMSSLAIFSTFDDLKEKVFGELPLEEDSITSAREISSNATQFIMSQIHQTRQDSSNKKRQTFWVSKAGSLNNIELRNDYLELPEAIPSDEITSLLYPQGYQVQVEVKAVGLNMADIFAIQGLYSATPQGSFIPGLEFSGIITSLSPEYEEYIASGRFEQDQRKKDREFYLKYGHKDYNVKNANRKRDNNNDTKNAESDIKTDIEFHEDIHNYTRDGRAKPLRVGDRVMGVSRFGAYTTIINADSRLIRHIPEGWSFAEGASLLVQGLTAAYGLLELGDTKAGDVVLVHSAAGGVGQLCLEICRSIGAYPIATVGSAKKAMYLLKKSQGDLHISQIIDRSICGTTYRNPLEPIAKSIERLATAASTKAAQDADQARINSSDHEETNDDEDNDGNKRHHNVKYNSNQTGLTSNVATLAIPLLNIASKVVSLGVNIAGPTAAWFGDKLCHREHKAEDFGLALDRALKAISAAKKAKNRLEFASNLNSNATEVSVVTWNLLKDKVAIQASENKLVRSRRSNNSDKREVVVKSPSMVRGIDVAMDSLLGFCFQPTLQRLAPEGKILIFGAGAYATPTNSPNYAHLGWEFLKRPFVDPMDLTPNNTSITGFNLIWLWSKIEEFDHLYELLHMHVQTKPTIGKTFDFKHIRKGLSYLQSGSSVGKVVMLVGNQD